MENTHGYIPSALLAGGIAGTSVDVALFPLDTVKTRLQSAQGFWKAGGFHGIYSGLGSAALGSAPTAALFFLTYESVKHFAGSETHWSPVVHMCAASSGEVGACLIRVPVEVVKQRAQANRYMSSLQVLKNTVAAEGFSGLYRGYISTVIREIPFSFIQFPVWEYLKKTWSEYQKSEVEPWQSSVCGAIAGCTAAGITTPLDVAKTRIMLAEKDSLLSRGSIRYALTVVHKEKGVRGFFSGILPRMMWISIGGAIFLGVYDKVKKTVSKYYLKKHDHIT
ncbi:S-adenosylmethionine mitochondrial carrier protein-like [Mercenaria mercenaria]|uniref:S-adenosylmethionine mitochondrial carrier protein-like n=1 Tax=Mercenaria mercenaria TaxID=6596 RepID=UPI001E1D81B9|nr:S-adenosylmethionine mitochondrial carrier protein-like [Mercenaria mercenaria]